MENPFHAAGRVFEADNLQQTGCRVPFARIFREVGPTAPCCLLLHLHNAGIVANEKERGEAVFSFLQELFLSYAETFAVV